MKFPRIIHDPAYPLTDPWFDGALWMRNEDPADPFAEQPRGNSRDGDKLFRSDR